MSDCITSGTKVTTYDPLIEEGTPPSCGINPQVNALCSDPQYAADNPDSCPNSSPLISITMVPSSGEIDVASYFGFRAIANYANGAKKDVTNDAVWLAVNSAIAAMSQNGLVVGIGAGETTIQANFRDLSCFGNITVDSQCVMDDLDVMVVIDVSQSMSVCDEDETCTPDLTRLAKAKNAARALLQNTKFTDQVGIVQFGGIIRENADGSTTKLPNAQILQQLSTDKDSILNAIDSCSLNAPCVTDSPSTLNCASGIGGGLQMAVQELNSVRARGGSTQKVIILCTDGVENVCNPDPDTIATDAKNDGILIVVAAMEVPDLPFFDCTGTQVMSHDFLLGLSSSGLAYFVASEDFEALLSRIPNIICQNGYGYGAYYYVVPPTHHYLDQLDYSGFINWVVESTVDLIGRDLYILFPPTEDRGAYVDLMGTQNNGFPGALLSRTFFDLPAGNYRVSLEVAGDQRVKRPVGDRNLKVKVSLPGNDGTIVDLWSAVIEISDYQQPFKPYTFDFSIVTPTSSFLKIEQWEQPTDDFPRTVGSPIDNILFANLDTPEVLLSDDFNDENPG